MVITKNSREVISQLYGEVNYLKGKIDAYEKVLKLEKEMQ